MATGEVSIKVLKQRCDEHPEDIDNVLNLVQRYSSLGKYNEALDLCRSMLKLHSRAYSFLLEFANVLYMRGDVKEARTVFKRLAELKPDRIEAWNNLGILELSNGNLEEAYKAFGNVLKIEPKNAGALCNTGNYFAEKGDAAVAATYFERALKVRGDFVEAWYNLGNSYLSQGHFKEAGEAFEKAIRYDPAFGSAYKNLGFACEQLGEYDRALGHYAKAASINKEDAGVQVNMAGVYMLKRLPAKALECGRRAARLAPSDPSSWSALRAAAIELGDGQTYYRAVLALISAIDDDDLARSISDLRDMGFEHEAEDLLEYTVKIKRKSRSVDELPFAESKAPKIASDEAYRIVNKRDAATTIGKGKLNFPQDME